jgi:deoxyadenosine/deoxycytidine kinase
MTLHVCILGIDGSGKSSVTAALPSILAAEMNILAGSAGEAFRITGPEEDHLTPGFQPDGLPLAARLSMRLKRAAKRTADNRALYPVFKLSQMLFQDSAARRLSQRYGADVMVSDGNALLSTTARAANYLRSASREKFHDEASGEAEEGEHAPVAEDLRAVFSYIFEDKPVPAESQRRLPRLWKGKLIYRLDKLLRLQSVWLPDVVVFLDLSPDIALERIRARRQKIDRHENPADLSQAREMYLKTVEAFRQYRSQGAAHCIRVDELSLGETIRRVVEAIRPHLLARQLESNAPESPLGTSKLKGEAIRGKALNHRYVFRYLVAKFFRGAWREPTFFFSSLGRLFLKEGYSANLMRVIYDRDEKSYGPLDRIFLEYPLHRAVYDRLQILTRKIEPELEARLLSGQKVRIFTAPSGFAYDLFRPLEAIKARRPDLMKLVHLVAADLDPHEVLQDELSKRAERLGIEFTFLRGDLTTDEMRASVEAAAPYDLALFVGLSSWLPKPQTLSHLRWLRLNLSAGGRLVTDSFTPAAYALSGRYIGYKASYYTPEVYKALLDTCGFDGLNADVESGRDCINHVLVAVPRMAEAIDAPAFEHALAGVKV